MSTQWIVTLVQFPEGFKKKKNGMIPSCWKLLGKKLSKVYKVTFLSDWQWNWIWVTYTLPKSPLTPNTAVHGRAGSAYLILFLAPALRGSFSPWVSSLSASLLLPWKFQAVIADPGPFGGSYIWATYSDERSWAIWTLAGTSQDLRSPFCAWREGICPGIWVEQQATKLSHDTERTSHFYQHSHPCTGIFGSEKPEVFILCSHGNMTTSWLLSFTAPLKSWYILFPFS